jgi:hypothetical protein
LVVGLGADRRNASRQSAGNDVPRSQTPVTPAWLAGTGHAAAAGRSTSISQAALKPNPRQVHAAAQETAVLSAAAAGSGSGSLAQQFGKRESRAKRDRRQKRCRRNLVRHRHLALKTAPAQ